jgi:hypothetical protein
MPNTLETIDGELRLLRWLREEGESAQSIARRTCVISPAAIAADNAHRPRPDFYTRNAHSTAVIGHSGCEERTMNNGEPAMSKLSNKVAIVQRRTE